MILSQAYLFQILCLLIVHVPISRLSTEADREVTSCILAICSRYFSAGKMLVLDAGNSALANDESEEMLLKMLHGLARWTISRVSSESGQKSYPADGYILLTHGEEFAHQLSSVRRQVTWNSRALFVVILRSTSRKESEDQKVMTTDILSKLWTHRAANVIVLVQNSDMASTAKFTYDFGTLRKHKAVTTIGLVQNSSFDIYTWFPFLASGCAGAVQESNVVLVDQWRDGKFLQGNTLFSSKVPNDLHGCPIFVSTFPWQPFIVDISSPGDKKIQYGGLEVDMMETIARASNLTTVYMGPLPKESKWGSKLRNGTWTGLMADMAYGRANVTFAALIESVERTPDFDSTKHYMSNSVVWVVPRAGLVPQWKSLFMIYSPLIWTLVATLWLVIAIVFRVQRTFKNLKSSLVFTLGILLGMSIVPRPRKSLLVMTYIFYSLLVNTAYQSSLISFLTEPHRAKQISDESKLYQTDMGLLTTDVFYNRYFDDIVHVQKRMAVCGTHESCLKKALEKNAAVVCDKAFATFIIPTFFIDRTHSGQSPFVIFPNKIMNYPVGMMFAKGNILIDRFNQIIMRTNEAGLMKKWRKDVVKLAKASDNVQKIWVNVIKGPKRLTLAHLHGAFIVLILGNALGLVFFCVEIVVCRPSKYNTTRRVQRAQWNC